MEIIIHPSRPVSFSSFSTTTLNSFGPLVVGTSVERPSSEVDPSKNWSAINYSLLKVKHSLLPTYTYQIQVKT